MVTEAAVGNGQGEGDGVGDERDRRDRKGSRDIGVRFEGVGKEMFDTSRGVDAASVRGML